MTNLNDIEGNLNDIEENALEADTLAEDLVDLQVDVPGGSIIRRQVRKRSKAWDEFLVIDANSASDGKQRAQCIHCKTATFIANSHYGTKNMNTHLKKCSAYQSNLRENSKPQVFNQMYYRELVARAIIRHGYAFSWVEHEGNRKIHAYLNHEVRTICRNTAKADVLKLNKKLKIELKETLSNVPGRISLTCDMWSACNTDGYLCLTAHYVDGDWKLNSRVLNFVHVESSHTGHVMYSHVSKLLQEWGIEEKIFSITLDNASSNECMQRYLKESLNRKGLLLYGGRFLHVRCAAHVLNLIVKDGLGMIDHIVHNVRESVKHVKWSEVRKCAFKEAVNRAGIKESKGLWQDVQTRWNSTFMMLDRALLFRDAFKELSVIDKSYWCLPSDTEWNTLEKIRDVLEPFYDITNLFSGSDYPTANLYFENVWKIDMMLTELVKSNDWELERMGTEMRKKFDKYWCDIETDGDYRTLFALAAILDPRIKKEVLKYCYELLFNNENKARDKVNELVARLESLLEEYDLHFMSSSPEETTTWSTSDNISNTTNSKSRSSGPVSKRKFNFFEKFDSNNSKRTVNTRTKLAAYLEDPRFERDSKLDILEFWKENQNKYGALSHLARDIMTVPLSTVASESTFSIGGRILNKWRSTSIPENVEALITSRSLLYGYDVSDEEVYFGDDIKWNIAKPT